MVVSGLEDEDLEREWRGEENGLPGWKRAVTGVWVEWGERAMARRTESLSREVSVFGDGGGGEEEVVVVEVEEEDDEVVILKVDENDVEYDGAEY